MKSIVMKYGLLSGAILGVMMVISIPLMTRGVIDFSKGEVIGYSTMVLAFIMVFLGIRAYRNTEGHGSITFGKAFKVGILITLVASAVYVITWQVLYWGFLPDFADKYAVFAIEQMRSEGASAAEIEKAERQMAQFKELYRNPFFNIGMTFLEVFPVGLLFTLISAAILRKREPTPPPATTSLA